MAILSDLQETTLIELAATIRKACSYPANAANLEAHTSGMAELISNATGSSYHFVREMIVSLTEVDERTVLEASAALVEASV